MARSDYPIEITEDESALGFRLRRLPNPGMSILDYGKFFPVVCYELGPSSYIFKVRSEIKGGIYYKWHVFLHFDDSETDMPDWIPMGTKTYIDPGQAVRECKLEEWPTFMAAHFPPERPSPTQPTESFNGGGAMTTRSNAP